MACRIAKQRWIDKIIAVDLVDERLERARAEGIQVIDLREHEDDLPEVVRELTDGRGPDSVLDAVGMEARFPCRGIAQRVTAHLPDAVTGIDEESRIRSACAVLYGDRDRTPGRDRLVVGCLRGHGRPDADDVVVRQADSARMGQANVKRWIPDILPS